MEAYLAEKCGNVAVAVLDALVADKIYFEGGLVLPDTHLP